MTKNKLLDEELLAKVSGGSISWKQIIESTPELAPIIWMKVYKGEILNRMRAINPLINSDTFLKELDSKASMYGTIEKLKEIIKTEYGINVDDLSEGSYL